MKIEELKKCIEEGMSFPFPIVFQTKEKFIPLQYIKQIPNTEFTTDKNFVQAGNVGIFGEVDDTHYVYECEELDFRPNDNSIIICKKISNDQKGVVDVVEVPSLDNWMIQDYAYSRCEGIKPEHLDWLLYICKYDIYRVEQEIDRICIFEPHEREEKFLGFIRDNIYNDLSDKNIFTMSNAIQSRDLETIKGVYIDLETAPFVVDVEPLGLLTLLYNNFKKMLKVWTIKNPTEQTTGLKSNQIWAINGLPRVFNKDELIDIFRMLAAIDVQFKTGEFPLEILVDYLVIKTQVRRY